jgi:hypothetical protein
MLTRRWQGSLPLKKGYSARPLNSSITKLPQLSRVMKGVHVGNWPILLQNSKVAGPQIFRKKTEREVIADSYNLNRITKVACEFVARR